MRGVICFFPLLQDVMATASLRTSGASCPCAEDDMILPLRSLQEVMIYGHSADVWGLAQHPAKPNVCATVCDGNRVFVWDTAARDLLRTAPLGFGGRAAAFSNAPVNGGYHLAIGGVKGHLKARGTLNFRYTFTGQAYDVLEKGPIAPRGDLVLDVGIVSQLNSSRHVRTAHTMMSSHL